MYFTGHENDANIISIGARLGAFIESSVAQGFNRISFFFGCAAESKCWIVEQDPKSLPVEEVFMKFSTRCDDESAVPSSSTNIL
mgnify:CR=1 FL=1